MTIDTDISTPELGIRTRASHARIFTFGACFILLIGIAFPVYALADGNHYILLVAARALALASVAVSLAFLLGNVGIVSLGHAVFLGIGMYAVGIPAYHGVDNGFLQIFLAISGAGLFAFLTGIIALRTSGIYFMMITLAFAQMVYYFFSGLRSYGADDGLPLASRSRFPGGVDFADPLTLYIACFAFLAACVTAFYWLGKTYYGRALLGGKLNDVRMRALGVDLFRYRLVAYTVAGASTGLSGFLFANVTGIATPAFMTWQRSADFLNMVALGGLGNVVGSIAGAFGILALEGSLPNLVSHWEIAMGAVLILVAFLTRQQPRSWLIRKISRTKARA